MISLVLSLTSEVYAQIFLKINGIGIIFAIYMTIAFLQDAIFELKEVNKK